MVKNYSNLKLMEKEEFLVSKKYLFLLVIFSFLAPQLSFSQCTNPEPLGNISQTFCKTDNSTIANLVATGGTIVWFDAEIGGNQYNSSDLLFNGITYYADDIDDGGCSVNRFAVTVTIYGDTPTNVDVFVGKCANENPTLADLSATGTNIEWYSAQTGGNLFLSTEPLVNGQTYWVQQTENGCTSDRLPTTVTIIDPSPTTVEAIQSFCSPPAPTINDLQASGTNIIWYATETSSTPLSSSDILVDGESYWAVSTSFPCESTIRIQTTVTIDTSPNAGSDGFYIECEENLTSTNLFNILGNNPDTTGTWTGPSNLSGGYLGTFEPETNIEGIYTYTVSSALGICPSESASVSVTINTVAVPTTIETTQAFCEIDNATIANLNATGNGILWYDTETSTSPLNLTDMLVSGEDYWAAATDTATGCQSSGRLVVTAIIISPPPPTTIETTQIFCEVDNPTISDISVGGNEILWYDTENATIPLNPSDALIGGEDYWATSSDATTGCQSVTRLVITVSINTTQKPTTSIINQVFCEIDNATVADLKATGNGILWYDTENATTPLNLSDALIDGEDYWATQTDASSNCESNSRLMITVTINNTQPPTTDEVNQIFCMNDYIPNTPTIADLSINTTEILWYDTEISTTSLSLSDALIDGEDYWAATSDTTIGCESSSRTVINVSIINPSTPTTTQTSQTFCVVQNPTIADLIVNGDTILWFDTEDSVSPLDNTDSLIDGEDYWAASLDVTTGCESSSKLMVTVTINDIPTPTILNTSQYFCASNFPTVAELETDGNTIIWYDTENDTTPLNLSDALIDGEDYWAATSDTTIGCVSSTRLVINVTLTNSEIPTIIERGQEFCVADSPTISDLNENVSAVNNGIIIWYDFYPNGDILNLSDLLINEETYYAVETVDNCSSLNPLEVTVTLDACEQYDIDIYDGFSPTENGTNDTFTIGKLRLLYPDFSVEFYNRWGNLIYTSNASKPDWNGRHNGNGELAPAGVYYFIIYFNKDNRKPLQRRLYLSR